MDGHIGVTSSPSRLVESLWTSVDKSGLNTAQEARPHGEHDQEQAHRGDGSEIFGETSKHNVLLSSIETSCSRFVPSQACRRRTAILCRAYVPSQQANGDRPRIPSTAFSWYYSIGYAAPALLLGSCISAVYHSEKRRAQSGACRHNRQSSSTI